MHKLSDINETTKTATCRICGPVRIRSGGKRQGWRCIVKARELRNKQRQYNVPHRKLVWDIPLQDLRCNRCPFIPIDKCQIDVHHIDGNHSNNEPSNLEILCANCHRLELVKE